MKGLKVMANLLLITSFIFILMGCATSAKRSLQQQELRNQIQVLEAELKQKDEEIAYLKGLLEEKEKVQVATYPPETKSRPSVKQIQIALKNAGYNPGPIDGKMGKQTRQAIRAFQRANGLTPDGKVGRRTWAILREYLYKKNK